MIRRLAQIGLTFTVALLIQQASLQWLDAQEVKPPVCDVTCFDYPDDQCVWVTNYSCDFCLLSSIPWPQRGLLFAWEGLRVRRQICGTYLKTSAWSWAECGFCVP